MDDWSQLGVTETGPALIILARLAGALVLGALVAFIYRRARGPLAATESFTVTLILLSILIAMVTQVIGDNVARAFSLVGALSIVRFRTVVRDTQDTAYVIFAVAVGMAMGAGNGVVALGGIGIVGLAAFLTRGRSRALPPLTPEDLPFELRVRLALGSDPELLLGPTLDRLRVNRRLTLVATARQGLAVDVAYRAALADESSAGDVVSAINRVEGVQGVTLQRLPSVEG